MIYLLLFINFFETGLFSVGGGLATLPFLIEIGEKTNWFTSADISNLIAISESTPGPLGVNMSTYVGYITSGVPGSIVASLSLVFPSVIIIIFVAKMLNKFKNSKIVQNAFYGLRPASTALIATALFSVIKITLLHIDLYKAHRNLTDLFFIKGLILAFILYVAMKKFDIHPIFYIIISAIIGIIFKFSV
ncbi:chromate transporter [Clostridium sp. BJN0001]|uniref:chromate transporter n=1 Tax=Clostridium sp. BJN0001 TaxID=2930219 RepID=UPI001FD44B97|nr:chromate transporter [Clostridium sp. BJN0001]